MELSVKKFRYENLDFGRAFPASPDAVALAQAEVENAKKLAEQIAAEMKPTFTYTEEELEALKEKIFTEGKIVGAEEARAENEKKKIEENFRAEEILDKINAQIATQAQIARAEAAKVSEKLKALAFAAAKKVIGEIDLATSGKIEEFINTALASVAEDADVQILLSSQTAAKLEPRLAAKGFDAKIVADDSIMPNDLKILWKNGYAERKLGELWKELGQIILENFNVAEFASEDDMKEPVLERAAQSNEEVKQTINNQSEEENGR